MAEKMNYDYQNEDLAVETVVKFLCENPDVLPQLVEFYEKFIEAMNVTGDYEKLHDYPWVKEMARVLVANSIHEVIETVLIDADTQTKEEIIESLENMQDDWCSDKSNLEQGKDNFIQEAAK